MSEAPLYPRRLLFGRKRTNSPHTHHSGNSLIRNCLPPRTTVGPNAEASSRGLRGWRVLTGEEPLQPVLLIQEMT